MRTLEPAGVVISRRDWPVLNRYRSHKVVNFLWGVLARQVITQ